MSKGSWQRPVNKEEYDKNYERIFKKEETPQLKVYCINCGEPIPYDGDHTPELCFRCRAFDKE